MVLEATPTWTEGYSYIYFFFIPIRSTAPPPSIILEVINGLLKKNLNFQLFEFFLKLCLILKKQPTRQAGDCWPMEGQKGKLLIQLAARANIIGFTMEHIDPAMSLSGGTPEAPNNFSVFVSKQIKKKKKKSP